MISILFVCTANRFRSPLAALHFAREVVRHGQDQDIRVSSAGTWTRSGQPVMPKALELAERYQLNLSLHKSRPVNAKILSQADLILVMEANHKEAINQEFPKYKDHVYLFSKAAGFAPFDVPDPYSSDEPARVVAEEIIDMIDQGYDKIIQLADKMGENK